MGTIWVRRVAAMAAARCRLDVCPIYAPRSVYSPYQRRYPYSRRDVRAGMAMENYDIRLSASLPILLHKHYDFIPRHERTSLEMITEFPSLLSDG